MGTGSAEKPTDAITALLQERRRYEQWLATLESRRAITPPHVYARVHSDYENRLSGVLDQLGGRSAELQQSVDALTTRVAALQTDENAKRDERYEAELRAAVGEYSADKWTELSEATDAEISRLTAQRTEATAELAQVQQLLHMASSRRPEPFASAAPAAAMPIVPAPLPPATLPPLVPPPPATVPRSSASFAAPVAPAVPAPAAGDLLLPVDELAIPLPPPPPPSPLAAPGGAGRGPGPRPAEPKTADGALRKPIAPPAAAPPAPPPAAPSASAAAKPGSMFDELEFLKSVVGPRGETKDAPQPAKASAAPAAAPAARRLSTPPEAGALNDISLREPGPRTDAPRKPQGTDSVPVFLRDVPTEQVKTLKCQECGSMNYPTEWYCERCGGELAAM